MRRLKSEVCAASLQQVVSYLSHRTGVLLKNFVRYSFAILIPSRLDLVVIVNGVMSKN